MKKALFPLILLASIASLAGCNNDTPTGEETIVDASGRTITYTKGSYSKIACIGAGSLRMFSYLESADKLVAVEDIENLSLTSRPKMFDATARPYVIANAEAYKSKKSCGVGGPQAQTIEAEKILASEPDLVISAYTDADKNAALEQQLGVPVVCIRYGNDGVFDSVMHDSLKVLGKILDREARAEELINFIKDETKAISDKVTTPNTDPVYICGLGNWGTTNHLMTAKGYKPFEVAKINNVADSLSKAGIQAIEKEKFVDYGEAATKMMVDQAALKNINSLNNEDKEMIKATKAYKSGQVYMQLAYNAYYTNLELNLVNTWWNAKVAHPTLMSDVDMTAVTNRITKAFLGKELASEIFTYGQFGTITIN